MFVKATERLNGPSRAGARRRGMGGERAFEINLAESPRRASAPSRAKAPRGLGSLLSLQSIETVEERRQRTLDDSNRLLDLLDELKVDLLSGGVDGGRLARLRRALENYDIPDDDPKLRDIVKAIDVRARVELAKLRMGGR